jgi:hypothetical protein
LSISILIMFDTLLLRQSLHCNTPLHFTTLHSTTLHNTYRPFTSSHLPFTALSFSFTHLHFLSFYMSHHITSYHIPSLDTVQISFSKLFPKKVNPFIALKKKPLTISLHFLFKYHFLLYILRFLFFFSDNIMADVASKQQMTALFLSTIFTRIRRHTELTKPDGKPVLCQRTFSSISHAVSSTQLNSTV